MAQEPNHKTEEVIIAFKTHFDIGYTDLASSVIKKYQTSMVEDALEAVRQSRLRPENERFVWTMPSWPMQQVLDGCDLSIKTEVEQALKEGYFAIHALPFTFETEASDPEMLARSLDVSVNIAQQYGLELPIDAKMTDVPEHSWFLPTLLSNAGVKFLHLGCNPASPSPEVPVLFWWEGPDRSRLLTMYWEKYYGTDLVPPENWPYKSWLAMIHTNDNHGPPSPEEVQETIAKVKRLNPNAKIRLGRMSDFYHLIVEEGEKVPVIRKDMPDTWIHGYMSMPEEIGIARRTQKQVFVLEALNTQLNAWSQKQDDVSPLIADALENSWLFNEHTFGLAMSHGHSGVWCYGDEFRAMKAEGYFEPIELSWKEKGMRAHHAQMMVEPELKRKVKELARSVDCEGNHITVYNPLPYKRSGMVEMQMHSNNIKAGALKDLSSGENVLLSNKNNIIRFRVNDVPAMGYKTFIPIDMNKLDEIGNLSDGKNNVLENDFLRVVVDTLNGGLSSVVHKHTTREMVDQESHMRFGHFFYERFSKEITDKYAKDYIKAGWHWAYSELGRINLSDEAYCSGFANVKSVKKTVDEYGSKVVTHFKREGIHPYDCTISYELNNYSSELKVTFGMLGKSPEPWPEGGWMTFPFNVENPKFKLGRIGGFSDPARDFINGSNRDYCFLNSGMAVLDDEGNGFAISSPQVPGVSLGRPGLWKYSTDYVPTEADVYFNVFNNQWSTNFTEWIEGSWSSSFYIWPVNNYSNETSVVTPSEEQRMPLLAAYSNYSDRSVPVMQKGIEVSMKSIQLTAFKPWKEKDTYLLRIWEQAGEQGQCQLHLPESLSVKSAVPVNLRGEVIGDSVEIKNNILKVDVTQWKPYSFVLIKR
jgi:hypothetical protein